MAAVGGSASLIGFLSAFRPDLTTSSQARAGQNPIQSRWTRRSTVTSCVQVSTTSKAEARFDENGMFRRKEKGNEEAANLYATVLTESEEKMNRGESLKDYFEKSMDLIRSDGGGGPRWFSPLECGARAPDSPVLLFLPGWLLICFMCNY